MPTKKEILEELAQLGVEADASSTKGELEALLEKANKPKKAKKVKPILASISEKEVTEEEVAELQARGVLVGYDPVTKIATIKE